MSEGLDALLSKAYEHSGARGLMVRTLVETGTRVWVFCRMRAQDVSFADLEIRVTDRGDTARNVPILHCVARQFRLEDQADELAVRYAARQPTISAHAAEIRRYLSVRSFGPDEQSALEAFVGGEEAYMERRTGCRSLVNAGESPQGTRPPSIRALTSSANSGTTPARPRSFASSGGIR